jgi:hypothetical protein
MNDREKVTHSCFSGFLTPESPLRSVFPDGFIPLSGPHSVTADLGEGPNRETARVFFIQLDACTSAQREAMAKMMVRMGQGTIEEARKVVWIEDTIPIREQNLTGVAFTPHFYSN